jgi:2-hydroxychromene-2-carboxylate isomerase
MHDLLLANQGRLDDDDLIGYANELGLNRQQFEADLDDSGIAARVREDIESADASGVAGTPTFFINGARHYGAYDFSSLAAAAQEARATASAAS